MRTVLVAPRNGRLSEVDRLLSVLKFCAVVLFHSRSGTTRPQETCANGLVAAKP